MAEEALSAIRDAMQLISCRFPKLQPFNTLEKPEGFDGFMEVMDKDYYVCLKTPNFPLAKCLTLQADVNLSEVIQNIFVAQAYMEDLNIIDYLQILQEKFEYFLRNEKHSKTLQNVDAFTYCSVLMSHIEKLGWQNITQISSDFASFIIETKDINNRVHQMHLKISPKYPLEAPVVATELPTELNFNWNQGSELMDIFCKWQEYLHKLQLFWDVMDSLDDEARIIDPPNPTRKHTFRRIILENQVSIQLLVSHDHPNAPPKCCLLGPSSLVSPLNNKIIEKIQKWDPLESIVSNIERLLGISVVKKTSHFSNRTQELCVECAVCYSLHLENLLPDITCDHCHKSFHLSCLHNWLKCLPTSRQTAQFVRGDCPYCTKAISCKIPL